MRLLPLETAEDVATVSANYIVSRINNFKPTAEKPFVLGLPTGSTPEKTYAELVRLNKAGKVSFKHVVTFNMDEYIGLPRDHPQSYWSFMHENLFNHVDIPAENVNILNGNAEDLEEECARYEEKIKSYGGVELFMGGVGNDGHIAFNEPYSSLTSRTRIKTLAQDTRIANARFFGNDPTAVPPKALTIGVGTLLDARELLILAVGHAKDLAVMQGVEGNVNHLWTITCIQLHPKAVMLIDDPASAELKVKTLRYFKDLEKENIARLSTKQ
ncbi:glucosamine-6-phosphate deaminase [Gregarina niphandrodes]|uniref:Glucosamine-6-phosphate isomerase n=1 Tax=Gregarina niphandrodes TaxID=110365 RepID=A0A023BBL7_GRENI|nr:glucosamine-6-phosphate deaminase [Gregarina niphandrodes]EZG79458.1 glucosamine-6-phosphate deaminase [Gregarina niphandrodes]|eukprot:XP_011134435.1 glucosamine-6-phosphate deaminase [Gregarina niphandrodes]